MADIVLGGAEKFVRAALAIKEAAKTARRNRKDCLDMERCVARVSAILSLLHQSAMMDHPAIRLPLDDLANSVEEALVLVTECQETSALLRLLGAGDMAKKLRRLEAEIMMKLVVMILAIVANTAINITLSATLMSTIPSVHPLLMQPQQALPYGMASRCEVPYASSSEGFRLPAFEASMHHSTGGGIMQVIVIKVRMQCDRCRSIALSVGAATGGTDSVAIAGDARDQLVVIGKGIDAIMLVQALRKKCGPSDIVQVGEPRSKVMEQKQITMPEGLAGGGDAAK